MYSIEELSHDFRAGGIQPGDTVMLHASVRAVGEVAGGPDSIHLALKAALTDEGTLMISFQPWDYAFGSSSALDRFLGLDGKIVLLGSDHDAVTFLHYVEHVADFAGKRVARFQVQVRENGCRVWRAMEEFYQR